MERKTLRVEIDDHAVMQVARQVLELRGRVEALERAVEAALQAIVTLGEANPAYQAAAPKEN